MLIQACLNHEKRLHNIDMICKTCPATQYCLYNGTYSVSYISASQPNLTYQGKKFSKNSRCQQCPYGGDFVTGQLRPITGFWGVINNDEVILYACPIGYCCLGKSDAPCDSYDSCGANRYGILCGSCKPGFSLSIMSTTCMSKSNCGASWIWVLSIIVIIMFVTFFIFSGIIIEHFKSFLNFFIKKLTNQTMKSSKKLENYSTNSCYLAIFINFVQSSSIVQTNLFLKKGNQDGLIMNLFVIIINWIFTFDTSKFSFDLCSTMHLTLAFRNILKVLYLISLFICWMVGYLMVTFLDKLQCKGVLAGKGLLVYTRTHS